MKAFRTQKSLDAFLTSLWDYATLFDKTKLKDILMLASP